MIELKKIDDTNFYDCISLEVGGQQKGFVASNVISLAQAYVAISNGTCVPLPFAIMHDNEMVGFVQIAYEADDEAPENSTYYIWRFMIDKNYQHRGYGKQAIEKIVEYIKTLPCGQAASIRLSYEKNNLSAKRLYEGFGFVETGIVDDDEIESFLSL